MQNIVSSCAVNQVSGFVQNVGKNGLNWVAISPQSASNKHEFGQAAMNKGAQQVISLNQAGKTSYFYVSESLSLANLGPILLKSSINADQVASSLAKAAAAVGSGGFLNMAQVSLTDALAAAKKPSALCCCMGGKCAGNCATIGSQCGPEGAGKCTTDCGAKSPKVIIAGSVPLGVSVNALLIPMCGGQPNWLSIGVYVALVVLLILIWWFFLGGNGI